MLPAVHTPRLEGLSSMLAHFLGFLGWWEQKSTDPCIESCDLCTVITRANMKNVWSQQHHRHLDSIQLEFGRQSIASRSKMTSLQLSWEASLEQLGTFCISRAWICLTVINDMVRWLAALYLPRRISLAMVFGRVWSHHAESHWLSHDQKLQKTVQFPGRPFSTKKTQYHCMIMLVSKMHHDFLGSLLFSKFSTTL